MDEPGEDRNRSDSPGKTFKRQELWFTIFHIKKSIKLAGWSQFLTSLLISYQVRYFINTGEKIVNTVFKTISHYMMRNSVSLSIVSSGVE